MSTAERVTAIGYRDNHHSPVRAWTASALRDVAYCGAVVAWSVVAFTILVTGMAVTVSALPFVAGVVVWVGFAFVIRWTTTVDRRMSGWQRNERVPAVHRRPASRGFVSILKTVTSDPQTWRELGWLAVTSILGFTLGVVAVTAIGTVLVYVSIPSWYWTVANPDDHTAVTNLGIFTVDSFGHALAVAAIGLLLAPIAITLTRRCAALHAALAVRVLSRSIHAEQ